jgi:hypothetical protein
MTTTSSRSSGAATPATLTEASFRHATIAPTVPAAARNLSHRTGRLWTGGALDHQQRFLYGVGSARNGRLLVEWNRGSFFEPPFETSRRPPCGDHARRRTGVPRPRVRRRRHARHRRRRRPLPRQPVSLLPRQGGAALLLPGPVAGPSARGACRRAERCATARRPPPRPGGRSRVVSGRRGGRLCRALGSGRAASPFARADCRQARSLRARRPGARRRGAPSRHRLQSSDASIPWRPQLDGALVPPGRLLPAGTSRRTGRRLCRRRTDGDRPRSPVTGLQTKLIGRQS